MPNNYSSITNLSASQLSKLIKSKKVSPVEVLSCHLKLIDKLNPSINAIVKLDVSAALKSAKIAESDIMKGKWLSPLHGIPIGIKDITETKGLTTTYGSLLYKNNIPKEDAEVVARLRKSGAIILCKTNTPEFAAGATTSNLLFGVTRNPWDLSFTPAGSSGGSAAAVASGMLPLAHGTDYGGSIRVPAAFCGLVGIRPTPGLIPNHPMPLAWDPGQVHGPLARTAEDAAMMLDAMVGESGLSPISMKPPWKSCQSYVMKMNSIKGVKIAYIADMAGIGFEEEMEQVCRQTVFDLKKKEAKVSEIKFDISYGRKAYLTMRAEWMVGQQFERINQIEKFGKNLANNVQAGLALTAIQIAEAQTIRNEIWHKFRVLLEKFDYIITPCAPVAPFSADLNFISEINGKKLDTYIDWIANTYLITMVGLPAASVPAGKNSRGLPIGLQVIGRRFSEPELLGVCKIIQKISNIGRP
jgi:amidase